MRSIAAATTLATLWLGIWAARGIARERHGSPTRKHPRKAVSLLGDALAASHDPVTLLPVIVELAADATGARGGRLLEGRSERYRIGDCRPSREEIVLPLEDHEDGYRLVLYPAARRLGGHEQELARSLAAQAAVAIENARLHDVVKRQAITDDLTGLVNRRHFLASLAAELSRVDRFGGSVAVLMADVDDFKQINDAFGHDAGDVVLADVASVLRDSVRDIDIAARLGGEEFAVILPETTLEAAATLAERLRTQTRERLLMLDDGRAVRVTVSIGVAASGDVDQQELLRHADRALYRAKALGKDRVEWTRARHAERRSA